MFRTFLALSLSHAVIAGLQAWLHSLQGIEPEVKWVKPEQLHFTLVFLGDILETQVEQVHTRCRTTAQQTPAFDLELGNTLGAFPPAGQPRVIWLGVTHGAGPLTAMQHVLAQALLQNGFALEARPFVPHLTLGRVRDSRKLTAWNVLQTQHYAGPWRTPVTALQIMRSELLPQGPRYTVLHTCELGH